MQVSFGKIYNVCHNENGPTAVQKRVSSYINDEFSKKLPNYNDKSLVDLLKEKKDVDVAIINKKNNVVRIELQKSNPMSYIYGNEYSHPFVPYADNGNRKLRLDLRLNEQLNYTPNILSRFMKKCVRYAVNPKSYNNLFAEEIYFEKCDRKMDAYNRKLEKLGVIYDIID